MVFFRHTEWFLTLTSEVFVIMRTFNVKQDTRCFWVCTSVYFTEVLEVSPVQEVFTQSAYVNIIRIVRLATSLTLANSIKHRKMIRQICT